MSEERGGVTERTFYPSMMSIIDDAGGSSVQEVSFNSVPDIVFELGEFKWLLSVKIGQDPATIKDAFLQYLRHKDESRIPLGMLVLLPTSFRQLAADADTLKSALEEQKIVALIDAGSTKEEIRDWTFPEIINFLREVVLARLAERKETYYPLGFVISLLQQHVSEIMDDIDLKESSILQIITDRKLLMDLGHLKEEQVEDVGRFLASYILLSQILFLRMLHTSMPGRFPVPSKGITHHQIRRAFARVLEINYRPIFSLDVLDAITPDYLADTFDLIWGLEIERVRYELPGRIFHELMPTEIRKLLAAFYTRPHAADLLAHLTIKASNISVLDPACGSGTILVASYRRKLQLHEEEHKAGNPHKRFCEEELFGADIMPFAVHLTSANLAAMDPPTPLERTQVIQGDGLELISGEVYEGGVHQLGMFHEVPSAETLDGESYRVDLKELDAILMNPPFTKIERGIRDFVNMDRFQDRVGGEVGLWGHFIGLANVLLREEGDFGAVIPINLLRGRESADVREIIFKKWTPLHVIKATINYGFSEWAEYRDVLVIARKSSPGEEHSVKFTLIKKDLTKLTDDDPKRISELIDENDHLRSDTLDINSYHLSELYPRFDNLMWFCSGTDFKHRDVYLEFLGNFTGKLDEFPPDYFSEGFTARPAGASSIVYATRDFDSARTSRAFLKFSEQDIGSEFVKVNSPLGATYEIERDAVAPFMRTPVAHSRMNVTGLHDFVAVSEFNDLWRVVRAAGWRGADGLDWQSFWGDISAQVEAKSTRLMVSRRFNPYSPSTSFLSFYSDDPLLPSDQLKIVNEQDKNVAKALCVFFNSSIFLSQFFLLKEESGGRYVDFREEDLREIKGYPDDSYVVSLALVFDQYCDFESPPLSIQFDQGFYDRYDEFWEKEREEVIQTRLLSILEADIKPSPERIEFDLAVCNALGVEISRDALFSVYRGFISEMIITRGLRKD